MFIVMAALREKRAVEIFFCLNTKNFCSNTVVILTACNNLRNIWWNAYYYHITKEAQHWNSCVDMLRLFP